MPQPKPDGYEDAHDRLTRMVRAADDPVLDSEELDELLFAAQCVDRDGRAPADAAWLGAWDLNAAAAEGWRRKAGALASLYDVALDGQQIRRSQAYANCVAQADRYARKITGSPTIGPGAPVAAWELTADVN